MYIYIYHIYLRKNAGTTYTSVCLQIMLFTKRKMWQKLHLYTHVKHRKPMVALGYSQSSDSCLNRALDSCPTTAPARPSTHRRHQRGYIEGLFWEMDTPLQRPRFFESLIGPKVPNKAHVLMSLKQKACALFTLVFPYLDIPQDLLSQTTVALCQLRPWVWGGILLKIRKSVWRCLIVASYFVVSFLIYEL